jgi:hypothetical protein
MLSENVNTRFGIPHRAGSTPKRATPAALHWEWNVKLVKSQGRLRRKRMY